MSRLHRLALAAALCLGCNEHAVYPISYEGQIETTERFCSPAPRKVDVLLVIDDSPSMSRHAETLRQNLTAIMETYEASSFLDYRIAVTTTSVSHPGCGPSERDGALVDTTCRQRIDDFVTRGSHEGEASDLRDLCLESCPYESLPSPPWIDWSEGAYDLPPGVSAADALACRGLVGVSGCEYEAPLDAAHRALTRAFDSTDPNYGFVRLDAALFVMFVTDEDDCSARPDQAAAFGPDGNALWPQQADGPTSGLCWNAAVECIGGPGTYDDCIPVDKDVDGELTAPDEAVLHSVERFVELLQHVETQKRAYNGTTNQMVFTSAVAGAPGGYWTSNEDLHFADSPEATHQAAFGIGPGCSYLADDETSFALPPPRIHEAIEAFREGTRALRSICDDDWTRALACIPGGWQPRPLCVAQNALDTDLETPGLQPDCVAIEHRGSVAGGRALPECWMVDGDWYIPNGTDACVAWLTDATHTESPLDDLSGECIESNAVRPLEVIVRRREPLFEEVCLEVTCQTTPWPF